MKYAPAAFRLAPGAGALPFFRGRRNFIFLTPVKRNWRPVYKTFVTVKKIKIHLPVFKDIISKGRAGKMTPVPF